MARALLVGCGCRGRSLGAELLEAGWVVRGTSRSAAGLAQLAATGIEAAEADPDRPGTILDQVGDVTAVGWLLGSAEGGRDLLEAVHGPRLESLLERLVDTPVRGFVYEAAGAVDPNLLAGGAAIVRAAAERWRIPVRILTTDPGEHPAWRGQAAAAFGGLAAG